MLRAKSFLRRPVSELCALPSSSMAAVADADAVVVKSLSVKAIKPTLNVCKSLRAANRKEGKEERE